MRTKVILMDILETCPLLRHLFLISQQMTWKKLDPCGWSYKHFMEIAFRLKHVSKTSRTFPVGCTPVLTTFKVTLVLNLSHSPHGILPPAKICGWKHCSLCLCSVIQHDNNFRRAFVRMGLGMELNLPFCLSLSTSYMFVGVASLDRHIAISGKVPQASSLWGPDFGNGNTNVGINPAEIP